MGDGAAWFFITVPKRNHEEVLIKREKELLNQKSMQELIKKGKTNNFLQICM